MKEPKHPALEELVSARELAERLGVSQATIRSWRQRKVAWLPEPIGKLDGLVWREQDLEGISDRALSGKFSANQPSESEKRKALGAFYTPDVAADFMAAWLVRAKDEVYEEPSFGDGAFIRAVDRAALQRGFGRPTWQAYELDEGPANDSIKSGLLRKTEVKIGDYLASRPTGNANAVIANPPFVRLRNLPERQAKVAMNVCESITGSTMQSSGSVWMPFLARMTNSLAQGGRMAVVLPLDFTYVAYAASMWDFLGRNFGEIKVIRVHERLFPEINQDVMILFVDKFGARTSSLKFQAFKTVSSLVNANPEVTQKISIMEIKEGKRPFQLALLPKRLQALISSEFNGLLENASTLVDFRIGYVAGDKDFFHPALAQVAKHKLPRKNLHRSLTNARRVRGQGLWTSKMGVGVADNLWIPDPELTPGEVDYITQGEETGVNERYKCRIRNPWYVVPGARRPDAIVTVFSETPLLVVNDGGWLASNSLLCCYVRAGGLDEFVQRWYTSLTLLSIGLQVHSLGGGVMIMVPNEASNVRIPRIPKSKKRLDIIEGALKNGEIRSAYESGDQALLKLVGKKDLALIRQGIDILSYWRTR
jgi:adenine-specific DNA-methyltransferase